MTSIAERLRIRDGRWLCILRGYRGFEAARYEDLFDHRDEASQDSALSEDIAAAVPDGLLWCVRVARGSLKRDRNDGVELE
jgi:hypothetical protein